MTQPNSIPLTCILPEPSFAQRQSELRQLFAAHVIGRTKRSDGYQFEFETTFPLSELVKFIEAERTCCAFFTFELTVTPTTLTLALRGPEGVNALIEQII